MRLCGWLGSPVYVSAKLHRRHYLDACLMGMVSHLYQDMLIEERDYDKKRTSSRVDRTEHCNQYVTLTSALRCDQDLLLGSGRGRAGREAIKRPLKRWAYHRLF